jgi:GTP-binding protein
MADVPGLIEGASQGKGLGHEFLRHIERTRVLIHLVDGSALDPIEDVETINEELASFGHGLADKPQIIAINKLDVPGVRELLPEYRDAFEALGYSEFIAVSALTRENVRELLGKAYQMAQEAPEPRPYQPQPMIVRHKPEEAVGIDVRQVAPDTWRVLGSKISRAVNRAQTEYHEGFIRLHRYMERQGVLDALREAGVKEGDTVRIGDYEFEWQDD